MLLRALRYFGLAGHRLVPGSVFECDEVIAQHLINRHLAERIAHGTPKATILSPTISRPGAMNDEP
jgi:hypothetical protein